MRWPSARLLDMASRIILTASSASLATSCGKCAASLEINSDFVMSFPFPARMASSQGAAARSGLPQSLCRTSPRLRTRARSAPIDLRATRCCRATARQHSCAGSAVYSLDSLLGGVLGVELGLEQRAEVGGAGAGGAVGRECFCIASVSSAMLFALIDRLIVRFLRSMLMIIALTGHLPSGACGCPPRGRARLRKRAGSLRPRRPGRPRRPWRRADLTLPSTTLPLSCVAT